MRHGTRRAFGLALAIALGASTAAVGGLGTAKAADSPSAVPLSLGTATADTANDQASFTLNGTIVVGDGAFTGTASGTAPLPGPFDYETPSKPLPPFTLQGPGLTGTCSGVWLVNPTGGEFIVLSHTPVNVVELSCSLQLGLAPAAETSLTLALAATNPPAFTHFTGVYGPGFSALPLAVPPSRGVVARWSTYPPPVAGYDLVGDISLGGRAFHGHASGSYDASQPPPNPFALTGTSPSGDLTATCTHSFPLSPAGWPVAETASVLSCTGAVGGGPTGTTSLIVLTPFESQQYGFCGVCTRIERSGVFVG